MNEPQESNPKDASIFTISIVGAAFLSAAGVVIGLVSGSQAVLFDGLITASGVPIALISLSVVRLAAGRPTEEFPLGLGQARPLLELLKALVLAGVLATGALEAIRKILDGGEPLPGVAAVIYAGASAVACFAIAIVMSSATRRSLSTLAKLERKTWFKDGLSSLGIALAFLAVKTIPGETVGRISVYIDQVLVLLIAAAFGPGLLSTIIRNARALLLAAPDPQTRRSIRRIVQKELKSNSARAKRLVVLLIGDSVIVDVEVTVRSRTMSLEWADRVRRDLTAAVAKSHPAVTCRVSFYDQGRSGSPAGEG